MEINDILFDEAIMRSMAQVVASENLISAALNEGEATLIKRTKEAEADRMSLILKGEGIAQMESILADGMVDTAQKLKTAGLDYSILLFNTWTESMKYVAEHGNGNVIFFDSSTEGMHRTIKHTQATDFIIKKSGA